MKIINIGLSYLGVFVLGLYCASQFKFGEPIDISRWGITVMFTLFFVVLGRMRDENNQD